MSTEKEDGVCENKLCIDLDSQCGIGSSLTQGIGSISINNNTDNISVCANCGKKGSDNDMNVCNKCNLVKYCNAVCKKKHRSKHKKQCERRVTESHDEELFKQPPSEEDCPICFLRLPLLNTGWNYYACCGKRICSGCDYATVYDDQGNEVDNDKQNECPFCRVLAPYTMREAIEREKKRMEAGDAIAIYNVGVCYRDGTDGYPQDYKKALELWHRAAELDNADACASIGVAYEDGEGVEIDKKKAVHYFELGAMKGCVSARHNLGILEEQKGNMDRALKHYMIAVRGGYADSLQRRIKELYAKGYATKDDYTTALRLYQTYLDEIKSNQRDEAAAAREENRYY